MEGKKKNTPKERSVSRKNKPKEGKQPLSEVKQVRAVYKKLVSLGVPNEGFKGAMRSFGGSQIHRVRQVYTPSSGIAMNVNGTGASYNGTTAMYAVGTTDSSFGLYFQLNDLAQASTFSSMFDQYRLDKVIVHFIPLYVQTPVNSAGYSFPNWIAIDYDDVSLPSSRATMQEYENVHLFAPYKKFSIAIKPRVAVAAYGGTFTSYANEGDCWIDLGSPLTQHYGLKGSMGATSTGAQLWVVQVESFWSFRSVR